jgi:hypothetical protein
MAFKTTKFELVDVPVLSTNTTGTRFQFPDLPKLRYTSIYAMEFYTFNDFQKSIISTNPLDTYANITQYSPFITLYANERQDVYRVPLVNMHRIQNSSNDAFVRSQFEFTGQKIVWDKSFIECVLPPQSIIGGTTVSFLFGVYYV